MTCEQPSELRKTPEYPIRSAFQNFYPVYSVKHTVPEYQAKAAACISACKTGKLGYSMEACPDRGFRRIHARSCNNRHCPCCQAPLEQQWVLERNSELVAGMAYYHVVFTLPHELNSLFLENPALLYSLLFRSASDTLIALCKDRKYMGARPGIVSVLHTWGQKLNYHPHPHPHLHVMLSGGGITPDGRLVRTRKKGFIFPVKVLGRVFRGKFLAGLKELRLSEKLHCCSHAAAYQNPQAWQDLLDLLYGKDWLPFLKETFNGNGNAVKYLARYAYRTAVSNSRITEVTSETVTLSYKDYADHDAKKQMVLCGEEFIRLFLQHVLPGNVHRVRFRGFLANCIRSRSLRLIGQLMCTPYEGSPTRGKSMPDILPMIYGTDVCSCPNCHHKMIYFNIREPDELNVITF